VPPGRGSMRQAGAKKARTLFHWSRPANFMDIRWDYNLPCYRAIETVTMTPLQFLFHN